jgi:hypothetical protein
VSESTGTTGGPAPANQAAMDKGEAPLFLPAKQVDVFSGAVVCPMKQEQAAKSLNADCTALAGRCCVIISFFFFPLGRRDEVYAICALGLSYYLVTPSNPRDGGADRELPPPTGDPLFRSCPCSCRPPFQTPGPRHWEFATDYDSVQLYLKSWSYLNFFYA